MSMPMLNGQHLKIRHVGGEWSLTLNGMEIERVRDCQYTAGVGRVTEVRIKFFPGEVEIEDDSVRPRRIPVVARVEWPGPRYFWRRVRLWARWRWSYGW